MALQSAFIPVPTGAQIDAVFGKVLEQEHTNYRCSFVTRDDWPYRVQTHSKVHPGYGLHTKPHRQNNAPRQRTAVAADLEIFSKLKLLSGIAASQ